MSQKYYVCHRRGTAEQWASTDVKPLAGELVIEIDNINNLHKLKIGDGEHSYADLAYLTAGDDVVSQVLPRTVTVTLELEKWAEVTSPINPRLGYYCQEVIVDAATQYSRLDLHPDADMLAEFQTLNLVFVTENNGGTITVYSVGDMPLKTYTMQATVLETQILIDGDKIVGTPVGTPTAKSDWAETDELNAAYILNKPILGRMASKDEIGLTDLSEDVQEMIKQGGGGSVEGLGALAYKDSLSLDEIEDTTAYVRMTSSERATLTNTVTRVDALEDAVLNPIASFDNSVEGMHEEGMSIYMILKDDPLIPLGYSDGDKVHVKYRVEGVELDMPELFVNGVSTGRPAIVTSLDPEDLFAGWIGGYGDSFETGALIFGIELYKETGDVIDVNGATIYVIATGQYVYPNEFPKVELISVEPIYANKGYVDKAIDGLVIPTKTSELDNDSGFITDYTETDPTVPNHVKEITTDDISNWNAKSDFSGSYDDLANKPTIPVVPTNVSAFENDSGYLTSYTETDPTVPSWAKAETKPAYSYDEITDKPALPTKTSELENDSGYITSAPVTSVNGQTGDVIIERADYSAGAGLVLKDNTFINNAPLYFVPSLIVKDAGSSTSGAFLATKWAVANVEGITVPGDGMTIAIRIPQKGVSGGILLSIDDGATYHPVVRQANLRITTQYAAGATLIITFNATQTASVYATSGAVTSYTGCWQVADYDSDTQTSTGSSNKTGTKMYIIGGTSQSSSGSGVYTYSNENVYIGKDNGLYAYNSKTSAIEKVATISDIPTSTSGLINDSGFITDINYIQIEGLSAQIDDGGHIDLSVEEAKVSFEDGTEDYIGLYTKLPLRAGEGINFVDNGTGVVEISAEGASSQAGSSLVEITYTELKALRDTNALIPGMFYRITDYICTTTQENTRAVQGTKFDVMVQALSKNTLSETASACAPNDKPVLIPSVLTNKVIKSHVVSYYYEYVDYNELSTGVDPNYRHGKDVFVDYEYLANDEGITVPVIYKTNPAGIDSTKADFNSEFDDPDYEDKFYYEGTANIDGITYDKWRLINESDEEFNWDTDSKCYVYTNQIVNGGTIELESFLYEEETDEYRLDSSAVVLSYYEFVDCNYGYGLTQDSEKKFAAYEYLPNEKGNIVPVLHDWCEDAIGYNENYYYEGRATIDDQIYDKWRKIELDATDEDDFGWDTPGKAYYYTNVIVEGGTSVSNGINFQAWEIKYCIDNDTTRFAWAAEGDGERGQAIVNLDSYCSDGRPLTRQPDCDGADSNEEGYYYAWGTQEDVDDSDPTNFWYSKNETITTGETVYREGEYATAEVVELGGGKGVIYYMKDEFNNECPYDFKNIQFIRKLDEEGNLDLENGTDTWCYTFGGKQCDRSITQDGMKEYNNNSIGSYYIGCEENFHLPANVFLATSECMTRNNKLGNDCTDNTFGDGCQNNTLGNNCDSNVFGRGYHSNTFGNDCDSNVFGNNCATNAFGDNCGRNTFGDSCDLNTLRNDCVDNTFGNMCRYNTLNDKCCSNTLPNNTNLSKFEKAIYNVTLTSDAEGDDDVLQYITIACGVSGTWDSLKVIQAKANADYEQIFRKSGAQEILVD